MGIAQGLWIASHEAPKPKKLHKKGRFMNNLGIFWEPGRDTHHTALSVLPFSCAFNQVWRALIFISTGWCNSSRRHVSLSSRTERWFSESTVLRGPRWWFVADNHLKCSLPYWKIVRSKLKSFPKTDISCKCKRNHPHSPKWQNPSHHFFQASLNFFSHNHLKFLYLLVFSFSINLNSFKSLHNQSSQEYILRKCLLINPEKKVNDCFLILSAPSSCIPYWPLLWVC